MTRAVEVIGQMPANDAEQRKAREIIQTQITQLTRLVDDLMDVSRITSGAAQLRIETLDLQQVIANAIDACRPLLTRARAEARHRHAAQAAARARRRDTRLVQVVSGLLGNRRQVQRRRRRASA
jgi:signal transduction histidine kinase